MKLQTRLLAALLGGVVAVSTVSQLVQQQRNAWLMDRLAQKSLVHEEATQWDWVSNLERAVSVSLLDAMTQGDMDKFAKLLAAQKDVKGLLEISVYNADAIATYSTVSNRLRRSLPADLKPRLLGGPEPYRRRTDGAFEMYTPLPVVKRCLECHNEFQEGSVSGVLAMHFSTDTLQEARQQRTQFVAALQHSTLVTAGATLGVTTLVLGGLALASVRYQIARPLDRITGALQAGSANVRKAAASIGAHVHRMSHIRSTTRANGLHLPIPRGI